MATPDEQWWEAQAGEYALGTLRGTERDLFEKILAYDADARARVQWWQQQLSVLNSRILPVEPPAHLLPLIMRRIGGENTRSPEADESEYELPDIPAPDIPAPDIPAPDVPAPDVPNKVLPHRGRRAGHSNLVWKTIAGLATAASIALGALLLQGITPDVIQTPGPELNMISIVQDDSQASLWVLSTRSGSDQLQVIALTPPPLEADRSHELWIVRPDDAGVSSVGLLPENEGESLLLTLPLSTADAQLFAVSLEPKGGSPEAVPTGPVLFSGSIRTISQTRL